jgi:hypothetical protein
MVAIVRRETAVCLMPGSSPLKLARAHPPHWGAARLRDCLHSQTILARVALPESASETATSPSVLHRAGAFAFGGKHSTLHRHLWIYCVESHGSGAPGGAKTMAATFLRGHELQQGTPAMQDQAKAPHQGNLSCHRIETTADPDAHSCSGAGEVQSPTRAARTKPVSQLSEMTRHPGNPWSRSRRRSTFC